MKKALPYIIILVVLGAVGFFLWKKMKASKQAAPIGPVTPKALSVAAAAAPKRRSGGWRRRIGGFAKKAAGAALAATPAGQALGTASALGINPLG